MLKHIFSAFTANDVRPKSSSEHNPPANIKVKVVGVGGGGGNAVARMRDKGIRQVETLALNTDVQALAGLRGIPSYAIGPQTVNGMGSGGKPEIGARRSKRAKRTSPICSTTQIWCLSPPEWAAAPARRIVDRGRHRAQEGGADGGHSHVAVLIRRLQSARGGDARTA